jgi:hypothetical protein
MEAFLKNMQYEKRGRGGGEPQLLHCLECHHSPFLLSARHQSLALPLLVQIKADQGYCLPLVDDQMGVQQYYWVGVARGVQVSGLH